MSGATAATQTDDRNGRAIETNKNVHVLEDNAEQTEESSNACVTSRLDAVTALDRASRAGVTGGRGGSRKGSESSGDEGKFELHGESIEMKVDVN